jgi:hypothetical protein
MSAPEYFIPNRDPRAFYPLRDYVRAVPASVAEQYIAALTAPGDLVIDPFASAPTVARVAHRMERRVIAVEVNPLWAWLTRAMATLPPAQEIDAAVARLGDTLKDDTPLRAHIAQLYATVCAACGKPTPADYFVHARNAGPIARRYTCAHCGETREDPATEEDLERFKSFSAPGMHYHLAFERVAPPEDAHVERVRRMLAVYTPRNLYALVTLTQKIDALFREPREREILLLLLLHLLDRGANFFATPDAVARLTTHKQFVEFNLWREMEFAAQGLARAEPALELAESLEDVLGSPSAATFIGRGNARGLARAVAQPAALVLTTLPSRRLAVWALSYFWCAWILGRDAAQPLVPFLDTRKDAVWERRWYFDILAQSFNAIAKMLRPDARVVFVFDEVWHQVIEMLLLAAAGTGFDLDAFLYQPRVGEFPRREFDDLSGAYRVALMKRSAAVAERPATQIEKEIRDAALAAGTEILTQRGEPLAFSWVHHAAYARAMREGLLAEIVKTKPKTPLGRLVHKAVVEGLSQGYAHDFDHYAAEEQFVWLRRARELNAPLIDRVEDAVREILRQRPASQRELEDALYRQFPGDQTPEAGLIELCAAAYADAREGAWHWRAEDAESKSRVLDLLAQIGERLGYAVKAEGGKQKAEETRNSHFAIHNFDLVWRSDGDIAHAFVWCVRAQFTDVVGIQIAPARGYLIVPENLVELMREKARRLPHLADSFHEAGWDFVRVESVERLVQLENIERHHLTLIAGLAPPRLAEPTQLELL